MKTIQDLMVGLKEMTGLDVQHVPSVLDNESSELRVLTPTGLVLFKVLVYKDGDKGWRVGGTSSVYPSDWERLVRL